MIRLLVCDDSREARELVRVLLADADVEIVGEAADGEEAVALARELRPDVVLMDVQMPLLDGVAATGRIRALLPSTRVVAFAGSSDVDVVMSMMEAGASGYCVKTAPPWELERAVVGAGDPIVRLAHALARSVGETVKAELVAREAADLTGARRANVFLLSPDGGLIAASPAGTATGDTDLAEADVARRACVLRASVHEGAICGVPLLADGTALGALVVTKDCGCESDLPLLASLGDLAAASLANERRLALMRAEARLDALTALPNRRAFDERLDDLVPEATTGRAEFALVLLDLDDFKQVNDTRGHAAGDEVLHRVAMVLRRTVRADEEVFRVGGEEFAIIVEAGREAAFRVAERVRSALRGDTRGQPLPTISAGVASVPGDAASKDELLRRADAALYAAKWAGKDRVLTFGGSVATPPSATERPKRVLLVDDDPGLRAVVRATIEPVGVEVDEAADARAAAAQIAAQGPPSLVILDVRMPGVDGIAYCRELKARPATRDAPVLLLTGADGDPERAGRAAGADAVLRKPFSPLALLTTVERMLAGREPATVGEPESSGVDHQTLLYARDLRRLLEIERGQRVLLQSAYRETVSALTAMLESRDTRTRAHSQRVQRYATELAEAVDPQLLEDPSLEYGFLLHDVGKIGIPDRILLKDGTLTPSERSLMETHPVLGEQMLGDVALLRGEGLRVVRSHHERWDGAGYPDRLAGDEIPLGARVFAVADTLDAMTSDRPYRAAIGWDDAVSEIDTLAGRQFDPAVVDAFREYEPALRRVYYELAAPPVGV